MRTLGGALRRMRRLRGMKQSHVGDLLGVSQATVSRWESGELLPSPEAERALLRLLTAPANADAALKRLVETASGPVHLVCDASHALLAASPARTQAWRRSAAELTGASLWPYASPEIQAVEARLPEVGWDDAEVGAVAFWTGPNAHPEVTIRPGVTLWERIRLQDGRDARLVTTVAAPPAHACWIEARA